MSTAESSTFGPSNIFARLGGAAAIDAAVEQFYVRILADPMLAEFFRHGDAQRKRQQKAFFATALGGPAVYQGADMKRAHARFPIQAKHFAQVARHLADTLQALGVPQPAIDEVLAAVSPLAADIVNTPSTPTP